MAVNVKISTVIASIAALSITDVTVLGLTDMPTHGNLAPQTLYPNAEKGIFGKVNSEPKTQGSGGNEKITLEYDLYYRYLHCAPVGSVGGLYDITSGLITNIATIMVSFLTNDTVSGAINLALTDVSGAGIVVDPAGNEFLGCDFTLRITEFCEVS